MNVRQLMEKLSELPPDYRVRIGRLGEIVRVEVVQGQYHDAEPRVEIRWAKKLGVG